MANTSMDRKAVCNNDGDLLIVPEKGRLDIQTELGNLMLEPGAEICVIPRGIRFRVVLPDGESRGYVQEVFGAHYELPERGPLGRSGLALERDFEVPVARFEIANQEGWNIVYKVLGELHECKQEHSPFVRILSFIPARNRADGARRTSLLGMVITRRTSTISTAS